MSRARQVRSVARMSENVLDTYRFVFTLGDALIRSGASSATTTKALLAVSSKAGLENVTVSVTLGQLVVSDETRAGSADRDGDGGQVRTRIHEVEPGALDINWRVMAEEIIEDYLMGDLSLTAARKALDREVDERPSRHWWRVTVGYGVLGAGFGLVLGGAPLTALGGAVTSLVISVIFRCLGGLGAPGIYSQAAGGFVAVLASAGINTALGLNEPTICIVAAIAARLAGIAAYGAVQDAITGWYLAAAGRLMEVATNTAGLVAGVAAGIATVDAVWAPAFELIQTVEPDTRHWMPSLIGAALVSGGFALSSGASRLRLAALAGFGTSVQLMNLAVASTGADSFLTISLTAMTTGAACVLVARPLNLSSNAIMTVALLPLFPGMLVYQGLLGTLTGLEDSGAILLEAMVTAFCLSVAGVLGQYIVSELLWAARGRQFSRENPGETFSKVRPGEYSSRDIMVPVFNRPFS